MSDPNETPDEPLNETTPPVDDHQIQDLDSSDTPLDETTPPIDLMGKAADKSDFTTPEDHGGAESETR